MTDEFFEEVDGIVGPVSGLKIPRFAGPSTFARLPRPDQVSNIDVAIVGAPFDIGTTYRPGARFGPAGIRAGSRLLRDYSPHQDVRPFGAQQVVDMGDMALSPFIIDDAVAQVEAAANEILDSGAKMITLGGDHTIALPLLRSLNRVHGPVSVLHFDAHLDTWDTYMNAPITHGTPFRRAYDEKLYIEGHSMHVGIRGPLYGPDDLTDDASMGFDVLGTWEIEDIGIGGMAERIVARVGDNPVYISIDIDVLDPAFAPGTGTPEIGGFSTRELNGILRGLAGVNLVGADIVEVSPAYDHAEITSLAAANLAYDLLGILAR